MGFIAKRLGITILTLALVSILTFGAFRLIPGDAALLSLGTEAAEGQIEALRAEMGLDKSFPGQYFSWVRNFLTGRMGNSSRFRGASVSALILRRLPVTFSLAGLSFLFIILIAVPASLFTVKKENSVTDRLVATFTALDISLPGFFLGVLFIWVFGILLRLFVPGAYVSYGENQAAFWAYLFFPALAIALPNAALVVKFLRASIFREFQSDYVRTARGKGAGRDHILRRHVLKNASLPAVTLLGMIVGEILSGSIVIEQVFSIPGIGRLLIASIAARDYPVIETLIIYITSVVILANTLADIAYQIIDPRIRLADAEKA
jgi:ABC-type dipeptide/oligopeptide/nickel transport system permease component